MELSNIFIPCIDRGEYRKFGYFDNRLIIEDRKYHLGSDRNCDAGTSVFNLLAGKVIFSDEVPGFGSLGRKGGVVIVESRWHDELYSILYGHLIRNVVKGEILNEYEVIGNVIRYETTKFRADHLHWGIWVGGGLPILPWGYDKKIHPNWIDPDKFIQEVMSERLGKKEVKDNGNT